MVFSSLLFLFRFLPLALLAYYAAPRKWRNLILFLFSLVFYAWGEPVYVVLILFSTLTDYTAGRMVSYFNGQGNRKYARMAVFFSVCVNLALLGFFKYADFSCRLSAVFFLLIFRLWSWRCQSAFLFIHFRQCPIRLTYIGAMQRFRKILLHSAHMWHCFHS